MTAKAKKRSVKNVYLVIKLNSKVQYFQDAVHYIHKILKEYHEQFQTPGKTFFLKVIFRVHLMNYGTMYNGGDYSQGMFRVLKSGKIYA